MVHLRQHKVTFLFTIWIRKYLVSAGYLINNVNIVIKVKISEIRLHSSCVVLTGGSHVPFLVMILNKKAASCCERCRDYSGFAFVIPGLEVTKTENPCHPSVDG